MSPPADRSARHPRTAHEPPTCETGSELLEVHMPVCDHRGCARPATHSWVCPHGDCLTWCAEHDRVVQARMVREGWERLRVPVG